MGIMDTEERSREVMDEIVSDTRSGLYYKK